MVLMMDLLVFLLSYWAEIGSDTLRGRGTDGKQQPNGIAADEGV
jgi:hypothetical protein